MAQPYLPRGILAAAALAVTFTAPACRRGRRVLLSPIARLSLGHQTSCGLVRDGRVVCWGADPRAAYVGRDSTGPQPRSIAELAGTTELVLGAGLSCARFANRVVRCWGAALGEQPRPLALPPEPSRVPWLDVRLADAQQLAVGAGIACALLGDGTARCWGRVHDGSLGDGTDASSAVPVAVAGLRGAAQVAIAAGLVCARLTDGTVQCWGDNFERCIAPFPTRRLTTPQPVPSLQRVVGLVGGGAGMCARLANGEVRCCGTDIDGRPNPGVYVERAEFRPIAAFAGATDLAVGGGHACAVLPDATVWCTGVNEYGELGRGRASGVPVIVGDDGPWPVAGLGPAVHVALGGSHSCVLLRDGSVACWGLNGLGELGVEGGSRARPVLLPRMQ